MKKFYFFFAFLVIGLSVKAAPAALESEIRRGYGDAFIFTEGGVEFAVFPDGQFDFYYNPRFRNSGFSMGSPNVNISFNAGYNYDPFVQYDDFGAVIQIENVPIYYDYYGRIIQAGHVSINYNHFGMVNRIGNLFLHYNPYNRYTHYSGYINAHNPYYVYRPWHNYYRRPYAHSVVVYHQPYRAYYHPTRIEYVQYHNYYQNNYYNNDSFRRSYYRPGDRVVSYQRGRRGESPREVRSASTDRNTSQYSNRSSATAERATRSAATSSRSMVRGNTADIDKRSTSVNTSEYTTRSQSRISDFEPTARQSRQIERNVEPRESYPTTRMQMDNETTRYSSPVGQPAVRGTRSESVQARSSSNVRTSVPEPQSRQAAPVSRSSRARN